jgi:hypothetical protein
LLRRLRRRSSSYGGGVAPRPIRGLFFYLRTPDARIVGAGLGTGIGANVGLVGIGAAGPVFLHVGTTLVVPTEGEVYEPTEGAVTVPYPPNPGAWARANVLVRVNAVAKAIVVSFMSVSFLFFSQRIIAPSLHSFHYLSAMEAAALFTSRRASMLQQSLSTRK